MRDKKAREGLEEVAKELYLRWDVDNGLNKNIFIQSSLRDRVRNAENRLYSLEKQVDLLLEYLGLEYIPKQECGDKIQKKK